MEKQQNLFPILSSVKYNKLNTKCVNKFGIQNETSSPNSVQSVKRKINIETGDKLKSIFNEIDTRNNSLSENNQLMKIQIEALKADNDRLVGLLSEEKTRCSKYQKKLQYIKENQAVFEKLKQAYISLKYNESSTRPIVEVREKGCQTFEGGDADRRIEVYPSTSVNLSENISFDDDEVDIAIEPGFMPIKKTDFNNLKKTVDTMKTLIATEPLSTIVLSKQREAKYRRDIADLYTENNNLKQELVDLQKEMEVLKQLAPKKVQRESNMLKKIIAKLDSQIRLSETESVTSLNDKEMQLVKYISGKYQIKVQQRMNMLCFHGSTQNTYRTCEDSISTGTIDSI